ncbi:A/G-specific adenine glycosylase [Phragmitibacter flavus]|uniref:Adenine DNA glycosylase n=1 Tax=Phragmitibacter flavus TaxID=2576071 RepID=A0A5R8KJW1_9BACT|nr:A/G-specific adenine glycosylase [Phragmitibacter flavus]TLD72606.1 A/G-specific adenine glycosylase [Phragmitibacter flavus]
MKSQPPDHAPEIAAALDLWFQQHGKDYPWRQTTDPYAILVSEMMLQQTQITTVLSRGFYARWMERFPDFATLAIADEESVLRTWEGLGYYRRARFLQKLALAIVGQHDGVFPRDLATVRSLPGIGAYTAGAVLSFAFDQAEPIVDGNIARVLSRVNNDPTPIDSTAGQKRLWAAASQLLQHAKSPRRHNSALMELGQTLCRTAQPDCIRCPIKTWCRVENPSQIPVKIKKIVLTEITERVFFHQTPAGIWLEQEQGNRRTGFWKLPALAETPSKSLPPVLHRSRYGITRYKVTLWVHEKMPDNQDQSTGEGRYISMAELPTLPMATPHRRALNAVLTLQNFSLQDPP